MTELNVTMSELEYDLPNNCSLFDGDNEVQNERVCERKTLNEFDRIVITLLSLDAISVNTLRIVGEAYELSYLRKLDLHYTLTADSRVEFFESEKFSKTRLELESYTKLNPDWDGYGAVKPDKDIIASALSILDTLEMKDIVAPKSMITGAGEVSLYWEKGSVYIEIAFDETNSFSYLINENDEARGQDDVTLKKGAFPRDLLNTLKKMA